MRSWTFAGVEKYLDTPVKRYSSGMHVRLGFAVAAHLEPDILVVDEVLAVGDAEFQKKAIGKMQEVSQGEGRTVLFVSHNMASVRNLCQIGVLLENGKIKTTGKIDNVVDEYLNANLKFENTNFVEIDDNYRHFATIKQLEFISIERTNQYHIAIDEPITLKIKLKNNNKIKEARLIGMLNYEDETRVGLFITESFYIPQNKNEFEIKVILNNHNLAPGKYFFDFNIGYGDFTTAITDYDVVYNTINFEVEYDSLKTKNHINYWRSYWGRNCFQQVELIMN